MNSFFSQSCKCYQDNFLNKPTLQNEQKTYIKAVIKRIKIDKKYSEEHNRSKEYILPIQKKHCTQFHTKNNEQDQQNKIKNNFVKLKLNKLRIIKFLKQNNLNKSIDLNPNKRVQKQISTKKKRKIHVTCSRSKQSKTIKKYQFFDNNSFVQDKNNSSLILYRKDKLNQNDHSNIFICKNQLNGPKQHSKGRSTQVSIKYLNRSNQQSDFFINSCEFGNNNNSVSNINAVSLKLRRINTQSQITIKNNDNISEVNQVKKNFSEFILRQNQQIQSQFHQRNSFNNPITEKNKNRLLKVNRLNRLKDQIKLLEEQRDQLNRKQLQLIHQLKDQNKQFQVAHLDLIIKKQDMESKQKQMKKQIQILKSLLDQLRKK